MIYPFYTDTNTQGTNKPAISNPVPQPAQMSQGASRSDLLPGNESHLEYFYMSSQVGLFPQN